MATGDFFIFSLILMIIIIILLILNLVMWNRQLRKSKDLDDAIYRLIEISKSNTKQKNIIDKSV
ncbi:hypothetical protein PAT3040_05682 [Paenibacillus agaridevorans]|uniref:Uncharacterized protein n=1 Tax=Paenibacillus agaridevorans TaxID=171404 RepID=A0A2R5EW32_9BACL|nr:hypothetical protein PAT3040_05682 [Paenibacillus agaridevorans]